MPTPKNPITVAVLLSPLSSLALASLTKEIFGRANRLLGESRYVVEFVSGSRTASVELSGISVQTRRYGSKHRYLLVTPLDGVQSD